MIQWRVSEVEEDGEGVVTRWFSDKCRKNKAFRKLQTRFQAKLDMIVRAGPDLVIAAVAGSNISSHIDKIRVSGRLTIRVLFMRGPDGYEITLLGASLEKDRQLVEPGIEGDATERYRAVKRGTASRIDYVYFRP